jgi:NAD(P)-dependent dehydrogenase (short-subunit alcohol dehydrogenase family)
MDQLDGKVAVVTGAASGIGRATGKLLAAQGMKVVLADVNAEALAATVAEIEGAGGQAHGVPTDVSDFAAMKALADAAYDTYGAVHVLHLNAGIASGAGLFDQETEPWQQAVGINLFGVIWGIKAFVPRMVAAGEEGLVLATSSGAGVDGTNYASSAYAVTKIAVASTMECLHGQLRDQNSAVRAGIVFPPLTNTNLAGGPEIMKFVEGHLQSQGIPAVLVEPEGVAEMVLDGIRKGRFYIRAGAEQSKAFFDGAISDDFLTWNEAMIRGRGEAIIADGRPDGYLW